MNSRTHEYTHSRDEFIDRCVNSSCVISRLAQAFLVCPILQKLDPLSLVQDASKW